MESEKIKKITELKKKIGANGKGLTKKEMQEYQTLKSKLKIENKNQSDNQELQNAKILATTTFIKKTIHISLVLIAMVGGFWLIAFQWPVGTLILLLLIIIILLIANLNK